MVRSSFLGARRRRSVASALCLLLFGAPGIGIACEKATVAMADERVQLCVVPPALGKPMAAGFSSEAVGRGDVDLDPRNRSGKIPPDVAPDKSQLFMMLLMLRNANGRYPFLVLR